jgi:2',3'-cyclic-nucleotide 2'-phosphodiesterase (5'-nucleotidase family)
LNLVFAAIAGELREKGVAVDVIVHGILEKKGALAAGPVTVGDVWRMVPYENTIGVMQLTPAQLREVLEENAGAYERFNFRGVWGAQCVYAPAAPVSNRVVQLTFPRESDRLAVAFNSYELASGGLRWNKVRQLADDPATQLVEYDFQTREAVIEHIRRQGKVSPDTSGTWSVERKPSR